MPLERFLHKFVHGFFRSTVKLVLGADIVASFQHRALNVVGQRRKIYFRSLASVQKAVKVFISSHTFYFLSRKYYTRFPAKYTYGLRSARAAAYCKKIRLSCLLRFCAIFTPKCFRLTGKYVKRGDYLQEIQKKLANTEKM